MVDELTPAEVNERIERGADVQIVDIRHPEQYEQGHIPGAINIPLNELPRRIASVDWSEDVVVACPIGQSSIQAARLIQSYEGVDDETHVTSMAGGYEAWEFELETDGADRTEVEP